jgi:hypothetical protein
MADAHGKSYGTSACLFRPAWRGTRDAAGGGRVRLVQPIASRAHRPLPVG